MKGFPLVARLLKKHSLVSLFVITGASITASGCSVVDKFSSGGSTSATSRTLNFTDHPSVNLGVLAANSTTLVRLSVITTGSGDATIDSTANSDSNFTFNGGTFPGTGGTCSQPVQGNCSVAVLFTAPATPGSYSNTVTVTYTAGEATSTISVYLSATVLNGAILTINGGANHDFGTKNLGTSTDKTLTVANVGAVTASSIVASGLSSPLNFKGGTYPGTGGTCSTALSAGASCTVVTTYAPTLVGATSKTLTLTYNNGGATTTSTLGFTGTAIALASLAVTSPVTDPYDYGTVVIGAPAVDLSLTLSNSGGQTATSLTSGSIASPFAFKGGSYPGTGGNCGASLAAAATCTMVVSFLPTTPGVATDTLVTTYNDGSGSVTLNHGLSGTGANSAVLTISGGPTYDYGSRTVGTNTDQSFTVTNTGGGTATAVSAAALTAPFTYKGGTYPGTGGSCSTSLGSGGTCTLVVRFSPVATGGFSDTINLSYNDGITTLSSTRAITGTGGSVANLSISDGPTFAYGSFAKSYTSDKTFTVTNVGAASASAMGVTGLSAPFAFKGGSYPGTGGTCGTTLGAAGTCTLVVTFSPTSAISSNTTMSLDYNNSVTTTSSTRALNGIGATITKIVGGGSHSCALYSTGIVKCWGDDFYGQLGDGGANSDQLSPTLVAGITTAIDIAAGTNHTCAVLANGRAQCWGEDANGQLGNDASLTDQGSPALVATVTDFIQIAAGGSLTCGLRATGVPVCWGADAEGGVGNNAGFVDMTTPQTVNGLTNMTDISVGRQHACGRRSDNTFRCWGSDSYGQLGNGGGTTNSGVPVTPAPGTATGSAAGGDVSCSFISGGSVKCWGADDNGQLGDSVALTSKTTPTTVGGLANVSAIALGAKHGCALTATSTVECWGDDFYGQLGDDVSTTDQPTPVAATGMTSVSIVGVGEYHSCSVLTTGAAYCWGANTSGQLGNIAPLVQQATPVQVQGL